MSEVSIANQALGWLGGNKITSFGDDSTEAKLISANYASIRDAVLEDHAWTFANARAILLPDLTAPAFEYGQRFLQPVDTIRILTADIDPNMYNQALWEKEGKFLLCNTTKLYVRYTKRIIDTVTFTAAFSQALAQRLAADLAIPLTESRTLQESHWALYKMKLDDAAATDGMQGRSQTVRSNRLLGSRNGFYPGSSAGGFVAP